MWEFPLAKGDGRYVKLMTALAKTDVLILDDWGLAPLSDDNRRDLLPKFRPKFMGFKTRLTCVKGRPALGLPADESPAIAL